MKHITKEKIVTVNDEIWWVNSKGSGVILAMTKNMINQLDAMLSHHSKIHLVRFDLHVSEYTQNNEIITKFNRKLFRWLKREYKLKRIGFMWCREQETSDNQHYHYALMLDGHKVQHPECILEQVKEIWNIHLNGFMYIPESCYYNIERGNDQSRRDAIYRISYLAKAKSKDKKAPQTKNYGTSRIKHKAD